MIEVDNIEMPKNAIIASCINFRSHRRLPPAALVVYPIIYCSTLPHYGYSQRMGVS